MAEDRHRMEQANTVKQLEEKSSLKVSTVETKYRNDICLIEDKHRQEIHSVERAREDLKN
jgi:hypothetical protein